VPPSFRIGADENGLGARLGPLIVTAVLARVDERGARTLSRKLPKKLAEVLGDSKAMISHGDVALGEAWARALTAADAGSPNDVFEQLSLEGGVLLREPCPKHAEKQCWSSTAEAFVADDELVARIREACAELASRGVEILGAKTSVVCTKRLNQSKAKGHNRFVVDLHSMERLVLALRDQAGADVTAVCGKVGAMADYSRFFGPLGGWLHVVLERERGSSAYRFPGLGELRFVQDADAHDVLVMLASLVGKWVRELLMARIASFYEDGIDPEVPVDPSGYNDPVTARFVQATSLVRKKRRIPDTCFERERAGDD